MPKTTSTVLITPHSLEPPALESTADAVYKLPGAHVLQRDGKGKLTLDDKGRLTAHTGNPGFLCFAIEQQGYAKKAEVAEEDL